MSLGRFIAGSSTASLVAGLVCLFDVSLAAGSAGEQSGVPPVPNFISATADGPRVVLHFAPSATNPPTTSFRVEAGSAPGLSDIRVFDTNGFQTLVVVEPVPNGTYYVRVLGVNGSGVSAPSVERAITVVGCTAPPSPQGPPSVIMFEQRVTLSWNEDSTPCGARSYVVEIGTATGLADLGTVAVTGTSITFAPVPAGTYYVRVRGRNALGLGLASPERQVHVASLCLPPTRAVNVQATTLGNSVTFNWQYEPPALPPNPPTSSFPRAVALEAGSAPGAADFGALPVQGNFNQTVWGPAGTYWTRVRTTNACGDSVVSEDVKVTLTAECIVPGQPRGPDMVGRPASEPGGALVSWQPALSGGVATQYVAEIGTAQGLANIRTQTFAAGPVGTGFIDQLPPGEFYGRVRATNVCGSSPPSSEVTLVVGGPCTRLRAPTLGAFVTGQQVRLTWPTGASEFFPIFPSSMLEIGTAAGGSDVPLTGGTPGGDYAIKTFTITLPPGRYYARVRLTDSCGASNPSNEAEFVIPPS